MPPPGAPLQHGIQHPARLVPLAFLAAIALGTGLLMLPGAWAGHGSAPALTALFTATSAVCVTGLAVVDTGSAWSPFGQGVILALFQVGGLGIMTGATLLGLLVSQRLRLATRLVAQAETRSLGLGDVLAVLKMILAVTLAVEVIVAGVLTLRLHMGYGQPWDRAAWSGAFHAVSAFNNAGFSTYGDSLMGFAADPWFLVPVMLAIVIGGIGFPVLFETWRQRGGWSSWSIHTRITLAGSLFLLLAGAVAMLVLEWNNTLAPHSVGGKLLGAAFTSVSARTAGFNSVDVGSMARETWAVHYVLMFIGGGSAGTAGGIKVTTFFLLGLVVWAEVRGARDVTAFNRRISVDAQRQALAVVLLGMAVLAFATLALMALTAFPVEALLFEAISAFATVGLSTGITPQLPPGAQLVLVVLMFVGRVGTITVATALALHSRPRVYRYPEEHPIVG